MKIPNISIFNNDIYKVRSSFVKKNYPDFFQYINDNFKGGSFSEKLYRYYHPNEGKCIICGHPTTYINFKKGFRVCCSMECAIKNPNRSEKIKNTCLKKYGVSNIGMVTRKKAQQTMLNKYGVLNALQNKDILNKMYKSNISKYGTPYTAQLPDVIEKSKQTFLKKYGVNHALELPEFKQKMKNTTYQNNIKKKRFIEYNNFIKGYTENGDWICKCPDNTCDLYRECDHEYVISPINYHNRKNWGVNKCTKKIPVGSIQSISSSSQYYFDQLDKYFKNYTTYYGNKNGEYVINYDPSNKKHSFKLDYYIQELNTCIEYNGVPYHMKPSIYKSIDISPIDPSITAKEIWDRDNKRQHILELFGIKVIVIWEDELPSPEKLADKILNN